MFYLSVFFQILWEKKIQSLSLVLLITSLVFSLNSMDTIEAKVRDYFKKEEYAISKALISDQFSQSRMIETLQAFSMVKKVELADKQEMQNKVADDLKHYQISLSSELFFENFNYYIIYFDGEINKESFHKFRLTLEKRLGEHNILIGSLKTPFVSYKEHRNVAFLMDWSSFLIIAILGFIYLINLVLVAWAIQGRSFLLQTYQRRQNIATKVYVSGFLLINGFAIGMTLFKTELQVGPMILWLIFNIVCALFLLRPGHKLNAFKRI